MKCNFTFYIVIHSGHFYSASSSPLLLMKKRFRHSTDTVSEFHAEVPQATVSEGLVQGSYVEAIAGFESKALNFRTNVLMSHYAYPIDHLWHKVGLLHKAEKSYGRKSKNRKSKDRKSKDRKSKDRKSKGRKSEDGHA